MLAILAFSGPEEQEGLGTEVGGAEHVRKSSFSWICFKQQKASKERERL